MNPPANQTGSSRYRRWLLLKLPAQLKRGLLDLCDHAGSSTDAEVTAALREFVDRDEASAASSLAPHLECMGCIVPIDVADRLRDICDRDGRDPDSVIECAVREHVGRARPERESREEPRARRCRSSRRAGRRPGR